jgi:uroporphyrin-III C-methyltransferase
VGPGDPGLLTLLALQSLQQADLVIYDALVDGRVLDLVRPGAQIVYAGKRGGRPSHDQKDITESLVDHARQGLRVARLKGGDPFVFGRGGEEARNLARNGIPFRIVPGITAGIGGLAYAGIPATHRDTNASVLFLTGHGADGDVAGVDWSRLSVAGQALVIYMPLGHLEDIAGRLTAAGNPADTPAALVCRATTPEQQVVVGTLANIAAEADIRGISPPTLLVVGEIVKFHQELGWFLDEIVQPGA